MKNLVFEASLTANSTSNKNGIITHANNAFIETWGYETKEEATASIASGLLAYYAAEYPQQAASFGTEIAEATEVMQRIYSDNFFPDQNTDYRERINNLSHFANNGCFRCHFTDLQTA